MGAIFENYYYLHSSKDAQQEFKSKYDRDEQVDQKQKDAILKRHAYPFAFYVASLLLIRSRGKTNTPMFYMSLFDDYFGLSNRGFENRHVYNAGLSHKCYKRLKQKALNEYKAETDEAVAKGLVVAQGDNFNQKFWTTRVDATRDLQRNANRCVAGVSKIPQQVDMAKYNRNVESLPDPSSLTKLIPKMFTKIKASLQVHGKGNPTQGDWKYFDSADVTQQAIYCVPLKMAKEEKERRGLPPHHVGLKHWRPGFVGEMNPGSNVGCYAMFHKMYEQLELAYNRGHYLVMRADINIYNMFFKVHVSTHEWRDHSLW